MKSRTYGLAEINSVAAEIVEDISAPVILLVGSMGAGKTTLIKAICKKLGVLDEVSSPTFALVNEYLTENDEVVYHFDLYRMENPTEALDIGIEEYFESNNICLVEWPEKLANFLPNNFGVITITLLDGERSLEFLPNCSTKEMPQLSVGMF